MIAVLAGPGILAVILIIALMPWMDWWEATNEEITTSFAGDERVSVPTVSYNRAVTIHEHRVVRLAEGSAIDYP